MHRFANLPEGHHNPLDYAVSQRDRSTLEMVKEAVKHRQTLLAYQPILYGSSTDKIAFHEGLIRVLDPTGRVIPAREFMPVIQDTQLGREVDVLALRAGLIALREHADLRLSRYHRRAPDIRDQRTIGHANARACRELHGTIAKQENLLCIG